MLETSYPNRIPSVIDLTTKSNALEFSPKFFSSLGPQKKKVFTTYINASISALRKEKAALFSHH